MSTHTIGLLLAILGGFVPLAKPLPWRIVLTIPPSQTFLSTLLVVLSGFMTIFWLVLPK